MLIGTISTNRGCPLFSMLLGQPLEYCTENVQQNVCVWIWDSLQLQKTPGETSSDTQASSELRDGVARNGRGDYGL